MAYSTSSGEAADLTLGNWMTVAALAAPHLLYAFIWFFPQKWMKAFDKSSVMVFENFAWMLKGRSF